MAHSRARFDYDTPEVARMVESAVLRVRDHAFLDSRLTAYVQCETHARTAFEQDAFRDIWMHREPAWNWEGKQPLPKENPDYHLVHEVRGLMLVHHRY